MKPVKTSLNFLLLLAFILFTTIVNAKVEPWRISSTQTRPNAFVTGDTIGVFPISSFLSNSNINISKIRNYVSLRLNTNSTLCLLDSFTCNVGIRITRWAKDSSSLGTKDTTLQVTYNKRTGTLYTEENRWYMEDMYRLHVEILSTSCDTNITRLLALDVAMEVEYYYIMANTTLLSTVPGSFAVSNVPNDSSYEINVNWAGVDFSEEYDLEWVYVDDYGTTETTFLTYSAPDFRNNASRVSIKSTSYNFHPIFEHGYVCFRVRATGKSGANYSHRVNCAWSSIIYFQISQSHEPKKNWQYVSTFAEDGKKKEVVSYMDGSLHNRQSVTQDNEKNMSIVGETIYDSEGRAGVNILPVPAFNNSLKFFNNFNLNTASTPMPYSKADFETLGTSTCRLNAPSPLSNTYGAGKYYSSSNPLASVAGDIHGYVPDAGGFPFVQVEYTADNTGRVLRQSGVGTNHKLGSTHETKYIYVTPDQEELIRLFGTNVGDFSHYKKNTVVDANGQGSISYLNASGKVVATALTGASPSNLNAISSYGSSIEITTDLLATQMLTDRSSRTSYNFTVLESGQTYKLYYRMQVPRFDTCLPSGNCYKGLYNVSFSIEKEDECQNQLFSGWPLVRKVDQNGIILDTLCSAGNLVYNFKDDASLGSFAFVNDTFLSLTLPVGSYTISRTVSVDEDAAQRYADLFLKQSTCAKKLSDFEAEYLSQVDSSLCYPTCQRCLEQAGNYTDFLTGWIQAIDSSGNTPSEQDSLEAEYSYNERIKECEALCDTPSVCDNYLKAMMLDVSPSGQYFKLNAEGTDYDNTESINVGTAFNWGNVGLYDKPVSLNGKIVRIGQLTSKEFIENFDHSWARNLAILHPEYCKYLQCKLQNDSSRFIQDFTEEMDFDSALAKGYFNPTNLSILKPTFGASSIIDPIFSRPSHIDSMMTDSLTSTIFNVLNNNTTPAQVPLYKYIFAPTLSAINYNSSTSTLYASYSIVDSLTSRFSETDKCRQNNSQIWLLFKYYYLRYRQNILDKWINDSCKFQIPAGKHRLFNDAKSTLDTIKNTDYTANDVSSNFADMAEKQCKSYAYTWMIKLKGCAWTTSSDSLALVDSLIAVCKRGTDGRNPMGATSVSWTWQNKSVPINKNFHDVIMNWNSSKFNRGICDEVLIDFPGDYDHDYYATYGEYTTPLDYPDTASTGVKYDYCTCNSLSELKSKFQSDTTICNRYGFAYYVNNQYGWNFTDSQLIIIMLSCQAAPAAHSSCDWPSSGITTKSKTSLNKYYDSVAATIKIPSSLKCVKTKQCLSYSQVAAAIEVFVKNYGNPDTSWFLADLMGKYLNHRFGYNLSYIDYVDFIDQYDSVFYHNYGYTVKDTNSYHNLPVFQDMLVNVDKKCNCNKLLQGWAIWKAMNPKPTATFQEYVSSQLGFSIPFEPTELNIDSLINHCSGLSDTLNLKCFLKAKYICVFPASGGNPAYSVEKSSCDSCDGAQCNIDTIWTVDYCLLDSLLDKGAKACTQLTPCEIISNVQAYDSLSATSAENLMEQDYGHDFSVFDSKIYLDNDSTTMRVICNEPTKDAQDFFETLNYLIGYDTFEINKYINLAKTPTWKSSTLKARFGDTCQSCTKQKSESPNPPITNNLYITKSSSVSTHKHSYTLFLGTDTLNSCKVLFDSINVSNLDSIIAFMHLRPLGPQHLDYAQRFSLRAILKNNDTITLTGVSYCIPIAECCPPNIKSRLCNQPFFPTFGSDTSDCLTEQVAILKAQAYNRYLAYSDSLKKEYVKHYIDSCMQHLAKYERFILKYPLRQHHYTLYYYDQAGNLTQTVPPNGVVMLNNTDVQSVLSNKSNPSYVLEPSHTFRTNYQYNSLNQVIWQKTPDGGESRFWYDELGRLIVSQNAKQAIVTSGLYAFSYTLYDDLGRIREVGEMAKSTTTPWNGLPLIYATHLVNVGASSSRTQITQTEYDIAYDTITNGHFKQHYLRSRVSAVVFKRALAEDPRHASYYDYDLHGNVKNLLQYNQSLADLGQEYKEISYEYDLVSGKVNKVVYQNAAPDAFYHKYSYDAENRITEVYTSRDNVIWDRDANYNYYLHGPLARTEIQPLRRLQGIDYVYSIQGWIKSVNSNQLKSMRDPGKDGLNKGVNSWANDVYGYSLSYFEGDYTAVNTGITTSNSPIAGTSGSVLASNAPNLYNGNIRAMVTSISKFMTASNKPQAMAYKYDQLNRIIEANAFDNFDTTNNLWSSSGAALTAYKNTFTYDANGNILTQLRKGDPTTTSMDDLTYHYSGTDNKLLYVDDAVSSGNYAEDIDDQSSGNYDYDAIGNLIKDNQEQIGEIKWTVYGKISDIIRSSGSSKPDLAFEYGPDGNRVMKIVKPKNDHESWIYTYYVRDASGNVMAVYSRHSDKKIQYDQITFSQINDSIINDTGATLWRDFMETTTGINTTTFKDAYIQRLLDNGLGIDYLQKFNITDTWVDIDPSKFGDVIDHQYGFSELLYNALSCSFSSALIDAVCAYSSAQFIEECINHDAYKYLDALYKADPTSFDNLYSAVSGGSATTVADKITDLMTFTAYDIATYIDANGGCTLNSSVLSQLSKSDCVKIITDFDDRIGGSTIEGIVRNYISTYGDYRAIAACFEAYNKSAMASKIFAENPVGGSFHWVDFFNTQTNYYDLMLVNYASSAGYTQDALHSYTMLQYFDWIKTYFGNGYYNDLVNRFYKATRRFNEKYEVTEFDIYGSSRLGIVAENFLLKKKTFVADYSFITGEFSNIDSLIDSNCMVHYNYKTLVRGYKHYELSNHLGNVLVVISDKRITLCTSSAVSGYEADVVSASDYYPFGMLMRERTYSSATYRFGFNGKEKDNEIHDDELSFELRIFDTRLSRFLSIDPRFPEYPWQSTYSYLKNCPIANIDYLGGGDPPDNDGSEMNDKCETPNPTPNTLEQVIVPAIKKNVLIIIKKDDDKDSYEPAGDNGDWYIIKASSLVDANSQFQAYRKGQQVDNLVIHSHGSEEDGRMGTQNSKGETGREDGITAEHVKTYREWRAKQIANNGEAPKGYKKTNFFNQIEALGMMSLGVKTSGNLLIKACGSGRGIQGKELTQELAIIINYRLNLYTNASLASGFVFGHIVPHTINKFNGFMIVPAGSKTGMAYPLRNNEYNGDIILNKTGPHPFEIELNN